MDVVFVLPYVLLFFMWIEDYKSMFTLCLLTVPLLDTFFYVETPDYHALDRYFPKLCMWMWFPCMFPIVFYTQPTILSMFALGLLYTIAINVSAELIIRPMHYESYMAKIIIFTICDPLQIYNPTKTMLIWLIDYYVLETERLLWHYGACIIAYLFHYGIHVMESTKWKNIDYSDYGLGNYMLYRLQHKNSQLLPSTYIWFPFIYLKNKFQLYKNE